MNGLTVRDLTILGCSAQQPTRKRNHGGYLLRWNGEGLLFDPGEGTQRQFIFANIAPPCVTRIFVSHFHGDHCLGLGSMLMRLNLDRVPHPIHCYYPASGKVYFDRLRFGTMYKEYISVIEHPIDKDGIAHEDDNFTVEAFFLDHGVDNLGYRIKEPDHLRFDKKELDRRKIQGPMIKQLIEHGFIYVDDIKHTLDEVSKIIEGDVFSIILDTLYCDNALKTANNASMLLCESTYLESERDRAKKHKHLTAKQAALIAKKAHAQELILTHFSARYLDTTLFVKEGLELFENVKIAKDFKQFSFPKRK